MHLLLELPIRLLSGLLWLPLLLLWPLLLWLPLPLLQLSLLGLSGLTLLRTSKLQRHDLLVNLGTPLPQPLSASFDRGVLLSVLALLTRLPRLQSLLLSLLGLEIFLSLGGVLSPAAARLAPGLKDGHLQLNDLVVGHLFPKVSRVLRELLIRRLLSLPLWTCSILFPLLLLAGERQ